MKIILGSSSKARRKVLEDNNFVFETLSPDIDELAIRTDDYYQLPLLIAKAKTQALISRVKEPAIIITADQVTVCDGKLHEKPKDENEAREFLEKYSEGNIPETVSALVVTNTENGKQAEGIDVAKVYFAQLPESTIDDFVKNGDPFTKSAGFAVESPILKPYIKRVEGDIDSVMGMPMNLLKSLIEKVK